MLDIQSVLEVVEAEHERTTRQVASLEAIVAAIVEGPELTATDDEHDPKGATIAYERAPASARLRQARADCDALVVTRRQLEQSQRVAMIETEAAGLVDDVGADIDELQLRTIRRRSLSQ